jgi:hypothetical protein
MYVHLFHFCTRCHRNESLEQITYSEKSIDRKNSGKFCIQFMRTPPNRVVLCLVIIPTAKRVIIDSILSIDERRLLTVQSLFSRNYVYLWPNYQDFESLACCCRDIVFVRCFKTGSMRAPLKLECDRLLPKYVSDFIRSDERWCCETYKQNIKLFSNTCDKC